ncbi:hypothetical protein TKK_0005879 [Trichogramma kaykai]|uniref:Uncharacterized protein n=1 Tax=Trichogramma kaykai TaxID=54128 RepID=A0ABD2XH08_9HYME
MFFKKAIREFFRQRMNPIDPKVATLYKYKLSLIYVIVGWNLIGLTFYMVVNDKLPKKHDSVDYVKLLGIQNANVVKFQGLSKVEDKEVHITEEEIQKFHGVIPKESDKQVEKKSS